MMVPMLALNINAKTETAKTKKKKKTEGDRQDTQLSHSPSAFLSTSQFNSSKNIPEVLKLFRFTKPYPLMGISYSVLTSIQNVSEPAEHLHAL